MMAFFLAAFSLGFLGSFHCIGMCGPIALALPIGQVSFSKKIILILFYNFGRIVTYSLFGLAAGLIGTAFVLSGYQQILSISVGLLLVFSVIISGRIQRIKNFNNSVFSVFNTVKKMLSQLFLKKGKGPLFLIGTLNGLLPCGLVYMGVAGALASGEILKGGLFMAVFGLGTLPVMLLLPFAGSVITVGFRNNIRKAVPVLITITGLLLILRGLNLGVPYLSPKLDKENGNVSCHMEHKPSNKIIKCSGPVSAHNQ
jgi:uncharacterized protein